jgi:hypothetical protein
MTTSQAIGLYEKLGFRRAQVFAVKRKNTINESSMSARRPARSSTPTRIVVDEARRRGIHVEVIDAEGGLFRLTYGGRSVRCRERSVEFTSAVAMSICDDKRATRRIVEAAGVRCPAQLTTDDEERGRPSSPSMAPWWSSPPAASRGAACRSGCARSRRWRRRLLAAREICAEVIVEEQVAGDDLRRS